VNSEKDAVVICTYRRKPDLDRCLRSILGQEDRPEIILVIDGDSDQTLAEWISVDYPSVTYVQSEKGLTLQRNLAIQLLADIRYIFFLDDDTELLDEYFSLVKETFKATSAIGVGVTPQPYAKNSVHSLQGFLGQTLYRVLGQSSMKPGIVTKSGLNSARYYGEGPADWLPGCSMTYSLGAIGPTRFDERRAGYGLGEDVDFGLKMSSKGLLYWTSKPKIIHHQSAANRLKSKLVIRQYVRHKWTLACDSLGKVSKSAVIVGIVGQFLFWIINGLRWRKLDPFLYAFATVHGLLDILKKGPLR
jgi:glycosyltransferase involved in cell wall biosynthesis